MAHSAAPPVVSRRLPITIQVCATILCGLLSAPQFARAQVRSIDGMGNNPIHEEWGSRDVALMRMATPAYADGMAAPAGPARPGGRAISNAISAQVGSMPNGFYLSDMFWQWGQFLDHDIDLTGTATPAEPFDIAVPLGDYYFDPASTGTQTIPMSRSAYDPTTGTAAGNPRQQVNHITAFIDGSQVYGSDAVRADALRTNDGTGRLKTSAGNLLPFNTAGLPNAGGPGSNLFLAGDVRANEQVGLTAMHTLFVREHNRLAAEIAAEQPGLTGEQIYQQARRIVGAQIQVITYNEFLPALLGSHDLEPYGGYNVSVNPGISNLFSTAAFRLGHSMLSTHLLRLQENGLPIPEGPLPLRNAFFAPQRLTDEGGIEPVLRGLCHQQMQELDIHLIDDVRNFLFGPRGAGGFDLAALNIQRGRDHGLPSYNDARVAFGLLPVATFSEISSDPDVQQALQDTYASVSDVDVWVGGLAEDRVQGAMLGELFCRIIADQFDRLRHGDTMWCQNDPFFTAARMQELEDTTLADIIRRNTTIETVPDDVFHVQVVSAPAMSSTSLSLLVGGLLLGVAGVSRRTAARRRVLLESGN